MTYSDSQMLAIWRRALGFEAALADASVERTDGIDLDAWLRHRMRQWYLHCLDTAPLEKLVLTDVAADASALLGPDPHNTVSGSVTPDQGWRRIVSVRLFGWHRPAEPLEGPDGRAALERMACRFTAPSVQDPVAVLTPGRLIVAPVVRPLVESLLVVADTGPDIYSLHESLLKTIPSQLDFDEQRY